MPTPSDANGERGADFALARAVVWQALALGLRAPDAGFESFRSAAARAALLGAARVLDLRRSRAAPLLPALERLHELAASATEPSLASSHGRLLGHARGMVSPFETEYGSEGAYHQPHELADIAGYYLAFGLEPVARVDERPDHVACECEFLGFLARKEAYLLASSLEPPTTNAERAETLEAVQAAARSFQREHLGRFGRAFATRLAAEDEGGFLGALGEVLRRFLALECQRLDLPPGPATLALRPPVPDAPMVCDPGACGVGEQP